jgi:pteridine reductase
MLERIALHRQGSPQDIADTVLFLANSNYITGQIINIDGGRTLNQ